MHLSDLSSVAFLNLTHHVPALVRSEAAVIRRRYLFAIAGVWGFVSACSVGGGSPSDASPDSTSGGNVSTGDINSSSGGKQSTDDFELPPDEPSAGGANAQGENAELCSVAILGDSGSNDSANFAAWLEARGPSVERVATGDPLSAFTSLELSTYDVVFLDWLAPEAVLGISPDDLSSWLMSGGRLVALSGYADYSEALAVQNRLLAPLDLGFDATQSVWGPVTQFAADPITEGLTSITFVGGRYVTSLPTDTVLMTLGDPPKPVGVVAERGSGRALLFGDEWITYDSEWSSVPEIEHMWANIFRWLGGCDLHPPVIR